MQARPRPTSPDLAQTSPVTHPPPPATQTFNIFLSRAVRENFDSIYERRSGLPGPKRGVDEKGRPRGFRAGPDEALERKREVPTLVISSRATPPPPPTPVTLL